MKTVAIEDIEAVGKFVDELNRENLEDITFTKDGIELNIPDEVIQAWEYMRGSNMDFIINRFYLDALKPEERNDD